MSNINNYENDDYQLSSIINYRQILGYARSFSSPHKGSLVMNFIRQQSLGNQERLFNIREGLNEDDFLEDKFREKLFAILLIY